ncbi:MAG: ParB N-terminal domain-containing protein [Sedimentisphaerales bacterium]
MANEIKSIPIDRLVPHPDNPNRMSRANFRKLVRNIGRTSRYEPLIVRPYPAEQQSRYREGAVEGGSLKGEAFGDGGCGQSHPQAALEAATRRKAAVDCYQIINGHHRLEALKHLGYKTVDVIVWDVDDEQADILLATLNRLGGSDVLDKKLALLRRLNQRMAAEQLAKLLPQTKKQIERLCQLTISDCRMAMERCKSQIANRNSKIFVNPVVFFLSDEQSAVVEDALFLAQLDIEQNTAAARKAAALERIARFFLSFSKSTTEEG